MTTIAERLSMSTAPELEAEALDKTKSKIPRDDRKAPPNFFSRKSSNNVVPRDRVSDLQDEMLADDDPRFMSPRKSVNEVEKLGDDTRVALEQ